jgi:hypothetical protein
MRAMLFVSVFVGMLWTGQHLLVTGSRHAGVKGYGRLSVQADRIRNLEIEILLQPLRRKWRSRHRRPIHAARPDGARSRSAIELAPTGAFDIGYLGRSRDLIND